MKDQGLGSECERLILLPFHIDNIVLAYGTAAWIDQIRSVFFWLYRRGPLMEAAYGQRNEFFLVIGLYTQIIVGDVQR